MKKQKKAKSTAPKVDPYLEAMMGKLLERLVNIEKKLETALSQKNTMPPAGAAKVTPIPQQVRRDRTLFEAICADCHKVCEVPFKPTEDRPVYCKECWAKRKGGGPLNNRPGMPILTPVALPPKPLSHLAKPVIQEANKSAKSKKSKSTSKKRK